MLALGQRLGQELFKRLPRGFVLTEQGQTLLETVIGLENGISPIVNVAGENGIRRIKISAGTWITHLLSRHVSELICDLSVTLPFNSADHVLDIAHRERELEVLVANSGVRKM